MCGQGSGKNELRWPFEARKEALECDKQCFQVLESRLAVPFAIFKQAPSFFYGASAKGNRQEGHNISREAKKKHLSE